MLECLEHSAVSGQHLGHQRLHPHVSSCSNELIQQDSPESVPLVVITHHEGRLGGHVIHPVESTDPDDPALVDGNEGDPVVVIHPREVIEVPR